MPQRAVNPTRMMLLRIKNRIKLAEKGQELIDNFSWEAVTEREFEILQMARAKGQE